VLDVGCGVAQRHDVVARRGIGGPSEWRPPERFDAVDQPACQTSGVVGNPMDSAGSEDADRRKEPDATSPERSTGASGRLTAYRSIPSESRLGGTHCIHAETRYGNEQVDTGVAMAM
jgi:hypothetical protein